jgi:DNA-binding response OmpR family regulator
MAKKILIVDDDVGILESLQFLLEYAGYEVSVAEDGGFVDQRLLGSMPDLILLDYWLPRQNGGEITKKLKSNNKTKHIPVIIISASYNIKDLVEQAGADDFVPKPYDINMLLDKVETHVSNAPAVKA